MSTLAKKQDRWVARSVVVSTSGVVASESSLASQAAAVILAQGGNAVDAAVAANAVLGVVAPHSNGLGGDLFAIVYEAATGKYIGLNASGWSPAGLSVAWMQQRGMTEIPKKGIHSVSVPGVVDGWEKLLHRFGSRNFEQVLAAAIHFAEDGFPVAERSAMRWQENAHELIGEAQSSFLPDGRAPRFGEVFRSPGLARSLRSIARDGSQAFYQGEIAERILELSQAEGGLFTREDLSEFSSEWVEPITTTYRGWTVHELPPNGAGIAALSMLNIMENFPLREYGANSASALHHMIEAKKLAYADMLRYVCDPGHAAIPVEHILSKSYAAQRAALIEPDKACAAARPGQFLEPGGDTVYLSVADRHGNVVSLIQSNYMNFGSGLEARGTSFLLQNRANLFSADPSHPNVAAGRKRPLHTIIPAFLSKEDQIIAFGIQGGWNQSQAHAQFVSNIVDHDMTIQEAIEAPRFTKATFDGFDIQVEARIPLEIQRELEAKGHQVKQEGAFSEIMGGGQAVLCDRAAGVNYGASDPRKDGSAIPEPHAAL
ncbi:gamma-glutamyltransferase [Granulicella sp. WH15]|uniref:gamma-glutamyltransferase n=1 Tax=Granulicella sp. WH15 TaxID=2602070 RepID=UPI0013679A98|nr:gamma-glutamyltransferase [Granulicella sp. WH15]QHN02598.1 gamma-glutamyltransferase [Granulicella sp. WH15]